MTFVETLYFIDAQIGELDFLIAHNVEPVTVNTLKTSKAALIHLKNLLIAEAKKRQGETA
jgi:hypothetical protein